MAPFAGAADWDPVGIQVGDPARLAEVVGVCHEVNEPVIDAAVDASVTVLVAYHPVLFAATTAFVAGRTPPGRALRLAEGGITLVVTHTAFDVAAGGTADALAAALGLDRLEPLGILDETDPARPAIGRLGTLPPRPLAEFADQVAGRLGCPATRVAGERTASVSRVAVVPGSGADFAGEAAAAGADVLVTGDVKHHAAVAARDAGLAVVDAGHIPTERPGLAALVRSVSDTLGRPVVDLTNLDVDPWS